MVNHLNSKAVAPPKPLLTGFSFGGPLDQAFPSVLSESKDFPKILPSEVGPAVVKPATIKTDEYWMLEALREATSGVGVTHPNPAVGCVIVDRHGKEVARGATQSYPGLHAETSALQKVSDPAALQDATLYVTLEPCSHFGNQPPCIDPILASPIRRIVVSRADPDSRVNGQGIRRLREAGKEVVIGVLSQETTAWNFPFFSQRSLNRPIVALKWAQTLDGQLADDEGNSKWITGPMARAYSHWLRQRYDAVLVGAGTWLKDRPKLDSRDCRIPLPYQPLPMIFDPRGGLLESGELQKAHGPHAQSQGGWYGENRKWAYITLDSSIQKITSESSRQKKSAARDLESLPHCHLIRLRSQNLVSELLDTCSGPEFEKFHGRPFQSIFVEGGPKTHSIFLKSGFADLIHAFIAPAILAGKENRISAAHLMNDIQRFDLMSSFQLGSDIVMEMLPSSLRQSLFSDISDTSEISAVTPD